MSTIQERKTSTDDQDFKGKPSCRFDNFSPRVSSFNCFLAVSGVSKDVMDATKKTASEPREAANVAPSDQAKGDILVDTIKKHFRRVPDSFEPKDLAGKSRSPYK